MFIMVHNPGPQIISRIALVKLSVARQTSVMSYSISIILRSKVQNYISMRRVNDQTKYMYLLIHEFER